MRPSPANRSHAALVQRGSVKTACTMTTTRRMSISGYATVTMRSRVGLLELASTGVTTHCQITADNVTATTALSMSVERS
jgi:hypothetical protein